MSTRGLRRSVAVSGTAVLLALAIPGTAHADTAIANDVVTSATAANGYTFATNTPFWSIFAVQPNGGDVDLTLSSGGTSLSSSLFGTGRTDFVAINSNSGFRPFGSYRAATSLFSGPAAHSVQFIQGSVVRSLPVPAGDGVSGPSDPDIAFAVLPNDRDVTIVDVFLTAGQKFWSTSTTAGNAMFLLESNPGSPATFIRNRSQASASSHSAVDGCTLWTANFTGWHAIAMIGDRPPSAPGVGGIAFALHRWNAAKPSTCPVKNFPGPTPA